MVNTMIWLPFNVPSLKNSKIKTSRGIFPSKTVKKYLQKLGIQKYSPSKQYVKGYVKRPNIFEGLRDIFEQELNGKELPIKIGFHFVRDTKRRFDFHNAVQIVADLMVAHGFIVDDDMINFLPFPLKKGEHYFSIDKEHPGVWMKILK